MCPDLCLSSIQYKQPEDRPLLGWCPCYPELHSAFPVQDCAAHTVGHCGLYCWSHKPSWHVEGAAAVVIIYKTMLSRAGMPAWCRPDLVYICLVYKFNSLVLLLTPYFTTLSPAHTNIKTTQSNQRTFLEQSIHWWNWKKTRTILKQAPEKCFNFCNS